MVERLIVPELFPPPGYAHVAVSRAGSLACTAGAVPLDRDGDVVAGGYEAQTRAVVANLLAALAAAGATADDVLKTTVYVVATDGAPLAPVWDVVRASPLAGAASTLLGVAALGYPGQLVEIEAIAARTQED